MGDSFGLGPKETFLLKLRGHRGIHKARLDGDNGYPPLGQTVAKSLHEQSHHAFCCPVHVIALAPPIASDRTDDGQSAAALGLHPVWPQW